VEEEAQYRSNLESEQENSQPVGIGPSSHHHLPNEGTPSSDHLSGSVVNIGTPSFCLDGKYIAVVNEKTIFSNAVPFKLCFQVNQKSRLTKY